MGLKERLKEIGQGLNYLFRGMQGLNPEEDRFNGLIKVDSANSIERTVITGAEISARATLRFLGMLGAKYDNPSFKRFDDIAEILDKYGISKDGQQWEYAKVIAQTRNQVNVQPIAMTGQPSERQEKKGFFRRGKEVEKT